jgi:hypothetical protein
MAVLFADPGGEYYFSSGVGAVGVWSATASASLVNNAGGASTPYAIVISNNTGFVEKSFPNNYGTLICGGRYFLTPSFLAGTGLFFMYDGATEQCDIRVDASGHLILSRVGTTLATSSNALVAGSGWHYIEFILTIGSGTSGSAQLWVDGVQWLNVTSVNTQNTGNATVSKVRFANLASANGFWKDMYILETTGGSNTTRLGDLQVQVIYPSAAGVNQQWTPNSGTQVSRVQDGRGHTGTWPDGDTTYISDSVSGHISDFAHDALSAASIFAVVHASYMRSDVGSSGVQQYALSGGTAHNSSTIGLGITYSYFFDVIEADPHTGSAWTPTNFNNATFGVAIP